MLSLLLAAALTAAVPGATPPPVKPDSVIKMARYGLPPDGNTDSAAPIQAVLDQLPIHANVRLDFPAGHRTLARPIVVTQDNVATAGAGTALTTFGQWFSGPSVLVGRGFADATNSGFRFSAGGRPDVTALTDGTAGTVYGFATQGRTVLHLPQTAFSLGGYTPGSWWDYWCGGATLEWAMTAGVGPGWPILGVGSPDYPAGPGCLYRDSQRPDGLTWFLAFEGEDADASRMVTFTGIDWTAPVNRFRVWFDPRTGMVGAECNGRPLPASWYRNPGDLTGKSLRANRKDYPFQVGQCSIFAAMGLPVSDFTLLGLLVSNVAVTADAGTDALRYGRSGPGVVARLATGSVDPGRLVRTTEGDAARPGTVAFGYALDSIEPGDGSGGFSATDHGVSGGWLLHQTYNPSFLRASGQGGRVGLATVRYGCTYTLRSTDCTFGGDDAAFSLYNTISVFNGTDFSCGGITTARETGCSTLMMGGLVTGFGPCPESGYDILMGLYGGQNIIWNLFFDNEGVAFSDAAYRVENLAYFGRSVTILGGGAANVGPDAGVFRLYSGDRFPCGPAYLSVSGFSMPNNAAWAAYVGGKPGIWFGSIDTRQYPGMPGGTGPAFDPNRLLIPAAD